MNLSIRFVVEPGISPYLRRAVGVGAVSLVSAACSIGTGPPVANQSPAPSGCVVSNLQAGPRGFTPYGLARAGPLWFSAFGRVDPGSPAVLATPNGPYDGWKVPIIPDLSASGTVELTGVQCSSGTAVGFCYSNAGCDWVSRLQSSTPNLSVDAGRHVDYTGYMVFPGPGLMRLSVSDSLHVLGTVVIEVPQTSIS